MGQEDGKEQEALWPSVGGRRTRELRRHHQPLPPLFKAMVLFVLKYLCFKLSERPIEREENRDCVAHSTRAVDRTVLEGKWDRENGVSGKAGWGPGESDDAKFVRSVCSPQRLPQRKDRSYITLAMPHSIPRPSLLLRTHVFRRQQSGAHHGGHRPYLPHDRSRQRKG